MLKRKRLLLAAAAGIFCLVALLAIGRKVFFITATCGQECRSLGGKPHPVHEGVFIPDCPPLKLTLALSTETVKSGEVFSLWYKLTLKNTCCERLKFDARSLRFLRNGTNSKYSEYYFKIWGPDGKQLEADAFGIYFSKYRPFYPYKPDHTASPRLMRGTMSGSNYYLTLEPGEEISTNPMKTDPYCMQLPEDHNLIALYGKRGERMLEEFCKDDLKKFNPPKPEPPPEGFRVLDDFVFKTPGKYKIQAQFNELISSRPIYPYAERFPETFSIIIKLIGRIFRIPLFPNEFDDTRYVFHPESNIVEFQVVQ